jgi:hypothetical protein
VTSGTMSPSLGYAIGMTRTAEVRSKPLYSKET